MKYIIYTIIISIIFSGCQDNRISEVNRIISPNGKVDAVIAEMGTDATVSTSYYIFIVEHKKNPSEEDLIFKADKVISLKLKWSGSETIEIRCDSGRIWKYRNFDIREVNDNYIYTKISLRCGTN